MTIEDLFENFVNTDDEFNLISNKLSTSPIIHALMLLDKLVPKGIDHTIDLIDGGSVYFNDIDEDELLRVITIEQVIDLCRCGVFYSSEKCCLGIRP